MDINETGTGKLIVALGDDVDRCSDAVDAAIAAGRSDSGGVEADYGFAARQLIRAVFAFFEGITFSIKIKAMQSRYERDGTFSERERMMAAEQRYELSEKGEIVERPAMIPLARNIRFAIRIYENATSREGTFDPSVEWWSCFQKALLVRHRLTHPKMPNDLDVDPDEVIDALKAYNGFVKLLKSYHSENGSEAPQSSPAA